MKSFLRFLINFFDILAYYNIDFNDSRKHIQQHIATLEKDPDRDVRDNVFSAFSEKEKTESPSSDEISEEIPALPEATQREEVPAELETTESLPSAEKEKSELPDVLD